VKPSSSSDLFRLTDMSTPSLYWKQIFHKSYNCSKIQSNWTIKIFNDRIDTHSLFG